MTIIEGKDTAEVGHYYIDQLGRVVVAVPESKEICIGCAFANRVNECNFKFPTSVYCDDIIFKVVTDE
jgi:hypothetical protein